MRRIPATVFVVLGLAVAVGLAFSVSPYASASPDGLEKVAERKGFLEEGKLHSLQGDSPIPDYAFPGIEDERLATGVAGFAGTVGVFGVALAIGWVARRRATDRLT
jgi:PDGLE domain